MNLPSPYAWLTRESGPKMLKAALALHGIREFSGAADNPVILNWARETGLSRVYSGDEIPWCGLFMAVAAKHADKPVPDGPLWALNWALWKREAGQPMLGDVLVFIRPGGGHVAIYVGEDGRTYHCLGGNQADAVSITRIDKKRLRAVRRPRWRIAQPGNVRPIRLASVGTISSNEA